MAIPRITKDLAIIQKLSDEPGAQDGLTSAELKAKFDEGVLTFQGWINNTLIPEIERVLSSGGVFSLNDLTPDELGRIYLTSNNIQTTEGGSVQQSLDRKQTAPEVPGEDGYYLTIKNGLPAWSPPSDYVTHLYRTAVIGTGWEGSGPYTQTISVPGIRETDRPFVDLVASADYSTASSEIVAFRSIYRMVCGNDEITVYSTDRLSLSLNIQIMAVRFNG